MDKKDMAVKLRKQGTSLGDISKQLGIAKSTASIWCRNIYLSKKMQQKIRADWLIKTIPSRMAGTQANRQKKLNSIERAKQEAQRILASKEINRDLLIAGIGLYWGEGSKSHKTTTFFVNSDPKMILIMLDFMVKVFKCKREDFICSVQINISHKPRIDKVLKFWRNLLHLPTSQFRNPTYISTPHKRVYDNHDSYFGIMRISIRKGRYLQYCMIELVQALIPILLSE